MDPVNLSVTIARPREEVYAYLADFTTTTEWDPGTVITTRAKGDGGVGTEYQNTSKFAGRETELTYVLEELVPNERIALRGENKTVVAHDTMDLRSTTTGTDVAYTVEFEFKGAAKYIEPLIRLPLKKLGDDAQRGMKQALDAL